MALGDDSFEERTEEASQHRRDEWKKEGRVFQSREIVSSLLLLSVVGALWGASRWVVGGFWNVFENSFSELSRIAQREWGIDTVMLIARFAISNVAHILAPIALAAMAMSVGVTIIQTGLVWTSRPMEMDIEKLDPMNGLKRIFSVDGLVELFKATIKFAVIGTVAFLFLKKRAREAGKFWDIEPRGLTAYLGQQTLSILFAMGIAMLVVAALDYAWGRFRHEQKMRMTKQEVKEERRQLDGNPQIKARIRALQKRIAQNKMLEDVKKADVVVTNPTHIAIALVYDREAMMAPRVVAKGADYMAERIKKIAREAGVPCVENVPLARAMYKALKIGQFISRELYNAVAEVLAYVYRLKGRTV